MVSVVAKYPVPSLAYPPQPSTTHWVPEQSYYSLAGRPVNRARLLQTGEIFKRWAASNLHRFFSFSPHSPEGLKTVLMLVLPQVHAHNAPQFPLPPPSCTIFNMLLTYNRFSVFFKSRVWPQEYLIKRHHSIWTERQVSKPNLARI